MGCMDLHMGSIVHIHSCNGWLMQTDWQVHQIQWWALWYAHCHPLSPASNKGTLWWSQSCAIFVCICSSRLWRFLQIRYCNYKYKFSSFYSLQGLSEEFGHVSLAGETHRRSLLESEPSESCLEPGSHPWRLVNGIWALVSEHSKGFSGFSHGYRH